MGERSNAHSLVYAVRPVDVVPVAFNLMLEGWIAIAQTFSAEWWVRNNEERSAAAIVRWAPFIVWPWIGYGALQLYWVGKRGQTISKHAIRIRAADNDTGEPVAPCAA